MSITVQKKENFRIETWTNFSSLEQAIEMAKQQAGRTYVLEDEKVVWENEEAIAWRYPKQITCHEYENVKAHCQTIVVITHQNESDNLWDAFSQEHLNFTRKGYRGLVEISAKIPGYIGKELKIGVFVFNKKIKWEEYLFENTRYQAKYIRQKSSIESIGNGQLPGHVWEFELKPQLTGF